MELISVKDRVILRELAKMQLEIASSHRMSQLRRMWIDHNMLQGLRPMITIESNTFMKEIQSLLLKCEGNFARGIEYKIWSKLVNAIYFKDDTIIDDYFSIPFVGNFKAFDINVIVDRSQDSGSIGYHFTEIIKDLEDDFQLLKKSTFGISAGKYKKYAEDVDSVIGDILPSKLVGTCMYVPMTQQLVRIMSMETMFTSMYDYPELFLNMMKSLTDDYLEYFKFLEDNGFLLPTCGSEFVAQGTYAFNTELKNSEKNLKASDIWGFLDSQETVGVSPEMFSEFIFPFYEKIASCFGLLSYGCCEAVHPYWDSCLTKLKNLRKLSISPWCDENIMGEKLAGSSVIYHRKPSPNYLGVDKKLDVEAFSTNISNTVKAAKGCKMEFTQRDVYTINSDLAKVEEYVTIMRNLTQDCY